VKKRILLLGLVILLAVALVGAAVWYNLGFRQRAEVSPVAMIKVFFDEAQTNELKQGEYLDWGTITYGSTYTMELWINNTGSVNAILQFNVRQDQFPGDWQNYWDYDGSTLAPKELLKVTITLVTPADIGAGHYEWESWIAATEAP